MKLLRIIVVVIFMAMPLGAFSGCGGGGAEIRQQTTTLGQELKDLDDAYKQGLLTEKEYKKVRKQIIEKHTD
jgi:uncharacterized membrane protein